MISNRMDSGLRTCAMLVAALAGTWTAPAALAQVTAVDQTVDQVEVFSLGKLLRLKFDNEPTNLVGLTAAPTSTLRACQSTAEGLTCLDGQVVRRWQATTEHPLPPPAPITGVAGVQLFSCTDTAFGFKPGNPCTALTVDARGGVWLAGQKPGAGSTYSLMQVVRKNSAGSCPTATPAFNSLIHSTDYCFRERVANRAKIVDLSPVEGRFVEDYFTVEGEGVLGVEAANTAVFYPYDFSKTLRTFTGWPAAIQSAAFFQRLESNILKSYLLVTVNSGVVYSRALSVGGEPTAAFVHANSDTDQLKLNRGTACFTGLIANQFRVRASEASGRVFVTNRNYCKAFVLTPLPLLTGVDPGYEALSTKSVAGTYTPDGLAVAAGAAINVAECTDDVALGDLGGCPLIDDSGDDNNFPALRMYGVELEPGSPTGLRIFKVVGIPDCRYLADAPVPPAECSLPGVVVNDPKIVDGTQNFPQRQYLNVTPMLPPSITAAFDASGKKPTGLPRMLIQPRYRAQAQNGHYFDAIFGIADPNIRFRETFTVEFDIGDPNLGGPALGCGLQQEPTPLPFKTWDIGTVVSERYTSVGGPLGIVKDTVNIIGQPVIAEHVDTMINKGCFNPTPKAGTRWSMYSYNMELAEDTPVPSSGPVTGFTYSRTVKYLGNLLLALHTELGAAQKKLACGNVDAIGNTGVLAGTPLAPATCAALEAQWTVAQGHLTSCAAAAATASVYPATDCDAFYTAFSSFKSQAETAASAISGANVDPANRAGELWSRTDVIKYVFNDHFKEAWSLGLGAE